LRGESLISQDGTLQWLEWTNRRGQPELACSERAAASSFHETVLDSEIVI
jgi:hypothetical protein